MDTSSTTEQPDEEKTHQANAVGATPEKALLNSNVTTPPPRPDHIEGRSDKPMVWDEDYLVRHCSISQNDKSPCPSLRRKGRNERTETSKETAPEEYAGLSRAPLPAEKNATAEDLALGSSPPLLSSSSEIQYDHQNSRSTEGNSAKPDSKTIEDRTETLPEANLSLWERPLPLDWRSSEPHPSNSSEIQYDHQNSSSTEGNSVKPDGKTIEARTETLPEANPSLWKRPIPLDWMSSEPNLSSPSGVNDNQYSSGTAREWYAAPHRQSEAWKGVAIGENPYLSKLLFPPVKARRTNDEGIEAPQGTAPSEQDPFPSRPHPSSEDARKSVKQLQIAEISSSVVNDLSPTPIGVSGSRAPEETAENPTLSSSNLPIPAPTPQDDSSQVLPRSRLLGMSMVGDYAEEEEEDSRSSHYFSNMLTPVNRRVIRVQSQTVLLPPRKRKYAAIEKNDDDDDEDGANQYATAHGEQPCPSQQKHLPSPSSDSRIQKIPTKNPSRQYYAHQAFGGWRVLDARNAEIELEKEKRDKAWRACKRDEEKVCNEAEEVGGSEYRKPPPQVFSESSFNSTTESASSPAQRQQSGYPHISSPPAKRQQSGYPQISCRSSDRLWKSWENKHLLRSHAAGLSFAQISASAEFSKGFVIRTEDECRERYETLQEWQLFQDEELLRAGESGENENFAAVCANKFSKGLVKRSEQQCRERYEFLKSSEFECFERIGEKGGADC